MTQSYHTTVFLVERLHRRAPLQPVVFTFSVSGARYGSVSAFIAETSEESVGVRFGLICPSAVDQKALEVSVQGALRH